MKKLFFFLLFTIAVLCANAQKRVELNVQAGLNLSWIKSDDLDKSRVKPGPNLGLYVNINLTDWLFLQPATLYSMKGGMDYDNWYDISRAYTFHYFEFPAHIGFKVKLKRNSSLLLHTGPYIAVGFADEFYEDGYLRGDVGWNFGCGIRHKRFYGGLQYGLGALDIGSWDSVYNRNLSINFGYYF